MSAQKNPGIYTRKLSGEGGVPTNKKLNKKHGFRLLAISLCAIVLGSVLVLPAAAEGPEGSQYVAHANTTLNIRSGPGTQYEVLGSIAANTLFYLTGASSVAGNITYWKLAGQEGWVSSGVNNDNFYKSPLSQSYTDTITGYDAYGDVVWEHTCTQTTPYWNYHFEVRNQSYLISCDCGWFYERKCPIWVFEDGTYESIFLGLDTNNDEFYDLKPGQSIDLPCRANTDYRPYQILEFYGDTNDDPPTVTIGLFDAKGNELKTFVFNWWVDIQAKSYGILFTDSYGNISTYAVSGEFMLYDELHQLYLDDTPRRYKHGSLLQEDDYWGNGRHVEYRLTLKSVSSSDMSPLDWVIYYAKKFGNSVYDLFDFFGLADLLTGDGNPFFEILSLDGVSNVFRLIGEFWQCLPPEILAVAVFAFVSFVVIGIVRWL